MVYTVHRGTGASERRLRGVWSRVGEVGHAAAAVALGGGAGGGPGRVVLGEGELEVEGDVARARVVVGDAGVVTVGVEDVEEAERRVRVVTEVLGALALLVGLGLGDGVDAAAVRRVEDGLGLVPGDVDELADGREFTSPQTHSAPIARFAARPPRPADQF